MLTELTAEQIAERAATLRESDAPECQGCGATPPETAPDNPAWFIDRLPSSDGTVVAVVRCPECW